MKEKKKSTGRNANEQYNTENILKVTCLLRKLWANHTHATVLPSVCYLLSNSWEQRLKS